MTDSIEKNPYHSNLHQYSDMPSLDYNSVAMNKQVQQLYDDFQTTVLQNPNCSRSEMDSNYTKTASQILMAQNHGADPKICSDTKAKIDALYTYVTGLTPPSSDTLIPLAELPNKESTSVQAQTQTKPFGMI